MTKTITEFYVVDMTAGKVVSTEYSLDAAETAADTYRSHVPHQPFMAISPYTREVSLQ